MSGGDTPPLALANVVRVWIMKAAPSIYKVVALIGTRGKSALPSSAGNVVSLLPISDTGDQRQLLYLLVALTDAPAKCGCLANKPYKFVIVVNM